MATIPSKRPPIALLKTVSPGSGPVTSMPSARAVSIAGAISSRVLVSEQAVLARVGLQTVHRDSRILEP